MRLLAACMVAQLGCAVQAAGGVGFRPLWSRWASLQHAMTSSEERTSAESRGLPHREVADGLEGGATQSTSVLEQILGC